MTRRTRVLLALGLGTALLTPARAQQPTSLTDLTALVRRLPPSTFAKTTAGVRGMELSVSSKLDPRLRDLVDASRGGGDVRSRSIDLGASGAALRVPVTAHASDAARAASLRQEVQALGGEIWASFDTTIWAAMAPASIDRLASSASLHYLTVQDEMVPTQVAGAGLDSVRATRVQGLHKSGVTGRGVKIGIIDFGFKGYRRLQQSGVVPAPKKTAVFPSTQTLDGPTEHGTACAEIIHAMAPDAELYLASISGSEGATMAAGQWLIQQGVDVISFSGGSTTRATDGQNDLDRFVDETTQRNNIVWIVAAGNSGNKHWSGSNEDRDGDGLIDGGLVGFVATGDDITVNVRWNDWGTDARQPKSTQDVDAFLFAVDANGQPQLVAKSVDTQNGNGAPREILTYARKGIAGRPFMVALKNARTTRAVAIHVFIENGRVESPQPDGSVSSPASALYAVGVGAWNAATNAIADYSSRGPTDDNRLKPEISGPAGLPSAAYDDVFHGTSAACPHVSGFAALLKSASPSLRGQTLRAALLKAAEPKGTPVPNMAFGYGWIDGERVAGLAPVPAPPIAAAPPASPIGTRPPADSPVPPVAAPPPVASSGKRVLLPLAWGGSVSTDFLDRIRMPADEPREFLTRVTTGRDLYRIGDGLKVGFKSSVECDYLLFHRSSTGEYTLLSPRDATVVSLAPGAAYLLPSESETFQVALPVGTEELLLLCARKAVDLKAADATGRPPAGLVVTRHQYQVSQ